MGSFLGNTDRLKKLSVMALKEKQQNTYRNDFKDSMLDTNYTSALQAATNLDF